MFEFSSWLGWLLAVCILPPFIISLLSIYPVRRFAEPLGLVARLGGHSTHTRVTPLGGGIGIYLGIILTFALGTAAVAICKSNPLWLAYLPEGLSQHLEGVWSRVGELWWLLGAASVLVVLGIVDDRGGVNPWLRLAVEFAVASFVVYYLDFGLTAFISVAWFTKILSVIWIVGLINSFNMLDNMDGLSGGIAAIIAVSMSIVMLSTPDPGTSSPQLFVAALLLVLFGSILGFLWHNHPPAKIFMGDGGSYLIGFMIAVAMLMATFATADGSRPHAMFAPLCVMAVPLYDMLTVIWIRVREGRSIFQGDKSHFSHRLVDLGLSRTHAVLTIYLVTGTCGLASILLSHVELPQAIMVLGIVGCMLLLVIILESAQWRKNEK